MRRTRQYTRDVRLAKTIWREISKPLIRGLRSILRAYKLSVASGDLLLLEGRWYVTHAGLLRLAKRQHCGGIDVQPVNPFCNEATSRYAFSATVYASPEGKGFVGYGDADPSNLSPLVRGAEMRIAETRAVNRALGKAHGIGICSVEEVGSFAARPGAAAEAKNLPQHATKNGNGHSNIGGPKVRDRLCQLIRQHQLDATLVNPTQLTFAV
ncbi:MAG TPA: hypothetical protein VFA90_09550 [Terriglobales bacterium]|nr:hypothetical protein [Terriglobales bacterium]